MWNPFKYAITRNKLVYSEENFLMIGNTRWHWASKVKKDWKYFHTSPNPIEFKDKDYSQLTWASVGPIPENIKLCPSKKIILDNVPLNNLPSNLGIDRALASWSAYKKQSSFTSKEQDLIVIDASTIMSVTKITKKGVFAGGELISGLRLQLSSMANVSFNLEIDSKIANVFTR